MTKIMTTQLQAAKGMYLYEGYRISGIIRERKYSQHVNYHSDRKEMFANLVIQLQFFSD